MFIWALILRPRYPSVYKKCENRDKLLPNSCACAGTSFVWYFKQEGQGFFYGEKIKGMYVNLIIFLGKSLKWTPITPPQWVLLCKTYSFWVIAVLQQAASHSTWRANRHKLPLHCTCFNIELNGKKQCCV